MGAEPVPRGERLTSLRALRGLMQKDVAARLEVSQGFISQVESGARPLPAELAAAAAAAYGVPVSYFSVAAATAGQATFRKSSRASVADERAVVATFDEAARLFQEASSRSGYHVFDVTELVDPDAEVAASNVRRALGLGAAEPVKNVTRALERLGVGVVDALMPDEFIARADHSGVSRPNGSADRPLVATIGRQSGDRARLTLLHETAHLLYDRDLSAPIRSTKAPEEKRAYQFAGAVLIPADVVRERVSETLTLQGYLPVKAEYGISVAALIQRARDLGVVSAARARSLFIQISSQGWRTSEPVPVASERPMLMQQAVTRGISEDPDVVADETGVPVDVVMRASGLTRQPEPDNVVPLHRR